MVGLPDGVPGCVDGVRGPPGVLGLAGVLEPPSGVPGAVLNDGELDGSRPALIWFMLDELEMGALCPAEY